MTGAGGGAGASGGDPIAPEGNIGGGIPLGIGNDFEEDPISEEFGWKGGGGGGTVWLG